MTSGYRTTEVADVIDVLRSKWRQQGVRVTTNNGMPTAQDPLASRYIFHFHVFGDKLVRVTFQGNVTFLEPGEELTVEVQSTSWRPHVLDFPEVVALNNGFGR